jgi:hypothetical protein
MNAKKYTVILTLFVMAISCRDESLYPLPYDDRVVGAYLRIYKTTSNIWDVNDLNNSAFDGIYEIVDEKYGDNLQEVEFYVSFRRGTNLTSEVLVKTIPGTDFAQVEEPTYSEYKRASIKLTAGETLAALANVSTTGAAWPSGLGFLGAVPGTLANNDQVIYRWQVVLKDGRKFSVLNPQGTNPEENNNTPNITTGQFYNAPSIFTVVVRNQVTAGSWVGTYSLVQSAIWSPNHSYDFHANYPNYLKEILFPSQSVTLTAPSGGLSTEREFQVTYRGQTVTMRINLEPTPTTAAPTSGTVYVPLQYAQVDCSSERGIYWTWPTSGNFTKAAASTVSLTAPLPTGTVANRGSFVTTQNGLTAGNSFTIGLDDDCDEYGRRNGYCTWTRRVRLTLTKL